MYRPRNITYLLLALCAAVSSQKISFGSCPRIPGLQDFDTTKYLGSWYQLGKIDDNHNASCGQAFYDYSPGNQWTLNVKHTEVQKGEAVKTVGTMLVNRIHNGRMIIRLVDTSGRVFVTNYDVINTDYYNFAVVYGCISPIPTVKHEFGLILSRNPSLTAKEMSDINITLEEIGLSHSIYQKTSQDNCG